jgi:SAM-dependent methyltransferase
MTDALAQFKEGQRQGWKVFVPFEMFTATAAPTLVELAGVKRGDKVLDVACGTGVVALAAAAVGAKASGVDLTPELIEHAGENARIAGAAIDFRVGDVEELPFEAGAFDVVLSQFGHMFAPRPDVAVREMLRVLKPGGTIAFSTWPPELFVGRMFAMTGRYAPAPPPGIAPPPQWGDVHIVRERLGEAVKDVRFDRRQMRFSAPSLQHVRVFMERNAGPLIRLVAQLESSAPAKLASLRSELDALVAEYWDPTTNCVRQDFLLTRATKV